MALNNFGHSLTRLRDFQNPLNDCKRFRVAHLIMLFDVVVNAHQHSTRLFVVFAGIENFSQLRVHVLFPWLT